MNYQALFEMPAAASACSCSRCAGHAEQEGEQALKLDAGQAGAAQTVSGFSRHRNTVAALPPVERAKINQIARRIIASFQPGQRPIRAVRLVGHADRDPQRGADFERRISGERALAVQRALIAAIGNPALAHRIRWQRLAAGARQLVMPQATLERDRARNRRVEVHILAPRKRSLAQPESSMLAEQARVPAPRPCCMLAPSQSIFDNDNIVDPKRLGQHNNRDSEQVGLTYSSQYGFLDLGHIRDMCDMTKWIYDHIVTTGGAPTTVRMIEGDAKIHTRIPRNLWELASRAIANDEGLAHEISSYEVFSAGGHNSSFSPEDLSSNNFGTRVAVIAIARKQPFNNAVTEVLAAELAAAGAVSKADTLKAFNAINGCWVNFRRVTDLLGDTYLQRRNFSAWPWKVPGMPNAPTPSWVGDSFATVEAFYSYTTKKGLLKIAFPKEIARIKSDARGRYGSDFDKPDCALPQPPRPRPQTCEQCAEEFNRCIRFSTFPEQCLANRSACLGRCSRR